MSTASFKNFPPENAEPKPDFFQIGDWVINQESGRTGIIGGVEEAAAFVNYTNGEASLTSFMVLKATNAEEFFEELVLYAQRNLLWNNEQFWAVHMPIANGRDKMSFEVLSELETHLAKLAGPRDLPAQLEEAYDAIENAPGSTTVVPLDAFDAFAAFNVPEEEQPSTLTEEMEQIAAKAAEAAKVNLEAIVKGTKKMLSEGRRIDAIKYYMDGLGLQIKEASMQVQALEESLKTEKQEEPAQKPDVAQEAEKPVKTEAGLIDPVTGEILEPSMILRKLGWTELPTLSNRPTATELDDFEAKLDQIGEKYFNNLDKVERWTAAHEKRCKPLQDAAAFWFNSFFLPMAKQLAPYRLPRFKSGARKDEYSKKSLVLPCGVINFESSGGAYVHDAALVKKHIEEKGIENFKSIGAEVVLSYNYPKLIAALNNGSLKDIPGTGKKEKDPLASVKLVSPVAKAKKGEAENVEQQDG
ncbi:MAG: hypothetical protein K2X27_11750 [Candidatus Obscuribacterales bacterium]|nr:hypothetical protein [Candidatus Obscuribacterales bacterium]